MPRAAAEVVYAGPDGEDSVRVTVTPGASLEQAIRASGILERHPQIDLTCVAVGVFGRVRPLHATARPGDRIEIYRPLKADPMEMRRRRARARR